MTTDEASYVVRLSSNESSLLSVDREHEYRNTVIAASTGVGAPVVGLPPRGHGALVIGFIDGETFTDESFSAPGVLARVAAACRRLHGGPRFVNDFDMFDIQRGYLALVLERGFRLPAGYLDHLPAVERIREALAVRAEPTVACNNDLLAGNFIDDGHRVRLIDYEYSGNNDACFELGNIWSECHLSRDQLEELVERLLRASPGQPRWPEPGFRASCRSTAGRCGPRSRTPRARSTSTSGRWGLEKYERAVASFRGPEIRCLLEQAQQR